MTLRTIEVVSPSAGVETLHVLRALFHVGWAAALVVAIQVGAATGPATDAEIAQTLPFLTRFANLPPADQRLFNAVREGIGEAERRRVANGAWPAVDVLASDGIPPFAPDPIDPARYAWTMRADKGVVNYVGVPEAASGRGTIVVIITEPDGAGSALPGETPVDEIHHRLANGTTVHVGVFLGAALPAPSGLVPSMNFDDGWKQILSGSPAVLSR